MGLQHFKQGDVISDSNGFTYIFIEYKVSERWGVIKKRVIGLNDKEFDALLENYTFESRPNGYTKGETILVSEHLYDGWYEKTFDYYLPNDVVICEGHNYLYHHKINKEEPMQENNFEFMQKIEVSDNKDFEDSETQYFITQTDKMFITSEKHFDEVDFDTPTKTYRFLYARAIQPKKEYRQFNIEELTDMVGAKVRNDSKKEIIGLILSVNTATNIVVLANDKITLDDLTDNFEYLCGGVWKPCRVEL